MNSFERELRKNLRLIKAINDETILCLRSCHFASIVSHIIVHSARVCKVYTNGKCCHLISWQTLDMQVRSSEGKYHVLDIILNLCKDNHSCVRGCTE